MTAVITDNTTNLEWDPNIYGNYIVYRDYDGNDSEIYLYNISSGTTLNITDNAFDDANHHYDGDYVTWAGSDGSDDEIFFYQISTDTTIQVTDNSDFDSSPKIQGDNIVWQGSPTGNEMAPLTCPSA